MKTVLLSSVAFAMMMGTAMADTYVVSMKGPAAGNPYWAAFEGCKGKGKELGVEVLVVAPPSETDIQAQISQIEDLIAQKVSGIALAPTDPAAPRACRGSGEGSWRQRGLRRRRWVEQGRSVRRHEQSGGGQEAGRRVHVQEYREVLT